MRVMKLALIGLGTVGTGVAKLLRQHQEHLRVQSGASLCLKWAVVRDPRKPRDAPLDGVEVTTELERVLADPEVEIAVELIGGVNPAFEIIARLLRAGKHVVTANKAVLAERGTELFAIARDQERAICFEASVGGGIPIVAGVSENLAANRMLSLAGILNGTSNYILSAMTTDGISYEQALGQAQELGFAEADPTLDVDGTDAAQKLAILSRLAFHSRVDPARIPRRGIQTLGRVDIQNATELGYVIKLLAVARLVEDELRLRVAPTLLHRKHPLGQVRGEYNAIQVVGDAVGDILYAGKGAGMMPTASSVVADILNLAIGRGLPTFQSLALWEDNPPGARFAPDRYLPSRFYLRFTISDQPGTLGRIAGILGEHGISIASVIQREIAEDRIGAPVPLVVVTHQADEGAIHRALRETDALAIVRQPTIYLHIAD